MKLPIAVAFFFFRCYTNKRQNVKTLLEGGKDD